MQPDITLGMSDKQIIIAAIANIIFFFIFSWQMYYTIRREQGACASARFYLRALMISAIPPDTIIHLQGSQAYHFLYPPLLQPDTIIHLQGSQATMWICAPPCEPDTIIHLQGSQAANLSFALATCLIPLFTYKVLKLASRARIAFMA